MQGSALSQGERQEMVGGSYIAIGEVPFGHTSNKVCKEKRTWWAEGRTGQTPIAVF